MAGIPLWNLTVCLVSIDIGPDPIFAQTSHLGGNHTIPSWKENLKAGKQSIFAHIRLLSDLSQADLTLHQHGLVGRWAYMTGQHSTEVRAKAD